MTPNPTCPACREAPKPPDQDVCEICDREICQAHLEFLEGLECPTCLGPLQGGRYCPTCGLGWT